MLFLDGVFVGNTFKESYAPSTESIDKLTHTIATRIGAYLERQGLLERDVEKPASVYDHKICAVIVARQRIAFGAQTGDNAFGIDKGFGATERDNADFRLA